MTSQPRPHGWLLPASTGAAALLPPLNSTMLAVALPKLRDEFDVGVVSVSWLVIGYLVAVAVTQPVGGRLGDAFGSLRLLRIGLVAMGALSLLAAFSPSFPVLVTTRSAQGAAAALLIPSSTAYLRKSVSLVDLAPTLGMNGAMISIGAAGGPVLGGLLLALGGWQALFLVNLPVVAAVFLLLHRLEADAGQGRATFRVEPVSLGALLAAFTGLALLGTALRSGQPPLVGAAFGLIVGGGAVSLAASRAFGGSVVDYGLFRAAAFARSAAMTALSNLVMYTTLIALPVYLRDLHRLDNGAIAGLLFVMSATNVVGAPLGGNITGRFGVRLALATGSGLLAASAGGVLFLVMTGGSYSLAVPLAMFGIAMGLAGAAQQTSALLAWPTTRAGSAAGTLSFVRYVGSVAGTSLLAAVLGGSPGAGQFELLMALLFGVALINLGFGAMSRRP